MLRYNYNSDKCFLVLVIYISLLCFISLFFFSQKVENNRYKKKPVGQSFVILFFLFLIQIKLLSLKSSMMHPCQKVLQQKIKRLHITTRRWVSSTRAHPPNDNPEDFGWILSEGGSYKVKWFEGHVVPIALEIFITEDRAWD